MARYPIPRPDDHPPILGPHEVSLRPVTHDDLPAIMRWRNDPEVVRFWDVPPASEAEYLEELFEPDDAPAWQLVIEHRGRPIGQLQYWHPTSDPDDHWSAGIDLYIGEPDGRDRGLGTEAVRVALQYLFEVKRLHRVTIDPEVDNRRAIRVYEKAGYRFDGVLRHNDRFEDGRWVDSYMMSILEDEWPAAKERWFNEYLTT